MPPTDERDALHRLVEAVTNLTVGLSNGERRSQKRHEEIMNALIQTFTAPQANGHDREVTTDATMHKRGDEISATFHVVGHDIPVSGAALWSLTKKIAWFMAAAGTGGMVKWAHEMWKHQ